MPQYRRHFLADSFYASLSAAPQNFFSFSLMQAARFSSSHVPRLRNRPPSLSRCPQKSTNEPHLSVTFTQAPTLGFAARCVRRPWIRAARGSTRGSILNSRWSKLERAQRGRRSRKLVRACELVRGNHLQSRRPPSHLIIRIQVAKSTSVLITGELNGGPITNVLRRGIAGPPRQGWNLSYWLPLRLLTRPRFYRSPSA
jgi:hypothetical protein